MVDRILPAPQKRLTNTHHFVCCGKLHVKFATMIFIIIRILTIIGLFMYTISNGYYINYWLDMLYEVAEFLSLLCLIVGYLKEKSKWMLPYMAVEFTWLLIALIIYVVSVSALLYPERFYYWLTDTYASTSESPKSRAFWTAFRTLVFSIFLAAELSVLLACTRYFDDEKERAKENRERPIIINVNDEPRNDTMVFMDDVANSEENGQTANTNSEESNRGFPNPNFTLEHDSEDEIDENDWHRKGKKTNVLQ